MKQGPLVCLLVFSSTSAFAQFQPEVEVFPVRSEKRPHLAVQQVAVANCHTSDLPGAQREELATIKVTARGPWERSAQHLASEKAAEIGANCLLVLSSYGKDNAEYPVHRQYKAFRVTVQSGPWRVLASPQSLVSASTDNSSKPGFDMPRLSLRPLEKKPSHEHGDHLARAMGDAVFFHEAILEPGRVEPNAWEDVRRDVLEYFGEVERDKLDRLAQTGKAIRVDLRLGAVSQR